MKKEEYVRRIVERTGHFYGGRHECVGVVDSASPSRNQKKKEKQSEWKRSNSNIVQKTHGIVKHLI